MNDILFLVTLGVRVIGGTVIEQPPHEILQLYRGQSGWCSASLVGPKNIITAAHCAKSGISAKIDGVKYPVSFVKHPNNSTFGHKYDVALGTIGAEVPGPYVTLGDNVAVGNDVAIFGYGCYVNGKYDGKLRVGKSKVSGYQTTDFTTATGAALCYGDSGGPTFNVETGHQVGVNSKGNISTRSWFLDLTRKDVREWLDREAKARSLFICGLNLEC